MASSMFEVPSSSPGFGFILRDRNHRTDQNAVVSQKNFVKDKNVIDSWIKNQNIKNKNHEQSKRKDQTGASSLVQIWEARLNQSNGLNSPRSDSGLSVVQETHLSSESPSVDGDSERTVEIESDSGESKWGRVADLIRRLSNEEKVTNGENGGITFIKTPRPCVSVSGKCRSNFPVVNSPKIRGRQAFTDLLMRLERDRYRELEMILERNAVSKFTQRGRLQTMLRLRNLERCLAIQDRTRSNAKKTGVNRIESGSTVLHLREKFRANAAKSAAPADQRKSHRRSSEMNKETEVTKESTRLKKRGGETLEAFFAERLSLYKRDREEEAKLRKEEATVNGTDKAKTNCLQMQEARGSETLKSEYEKKEEEKTSPTVCMIEELRMRQSQMENFKQETPKTQSVVQESNEMDEYLEKQETSYSSGWEEQEEYEDEQYYYGEVNNEWLSEISRPRSYWEELRKSRYLEVMNTQSEKEDIRRLLERRTVTDFLESGLREKIDNLMMSRVHTHSNNHPEEWELQQQEQYEETNETKEEEETLMEGEEQDDRDDSSRSSCSQTFASSPAGSWSSQDTGVTSTQILSVQNHDSQEMELMRDMRSQIQQLQQEMSLLRDSVKTCLDANATLQQSVRDNPLKRNCCVCNETQVEAVLYKCGHMCTCLKCANELQWSGGKCPICRAQILDVVRVFFDTKN